MIFVNLINMMRHLVKNYITLQRNRHLEKEYTADHFLGKLDEFIVRIGFVNKR